MPSLRQVSTGRYVFPDCIILGGTTVKNEDRTDSVVRNAQSTVLPYINTSFLPFLYIFIRLTLKNTQIPIVAVGPLIYIRKHRLMILSIVQLRIILPIRRAQLLFRLA
jgi:hypothetical protein